ncbi:MAG: helix-turn-helix transcriptional regulator [Clostridiales bacterium]|nr:helix-turn-helix transcriptional regulator [Clostridiales bacterium]
MDKELKDMGQRIRDCRRECGITQEELAERIGTSVQFVSSVERGLVYPSVKNLVRICKELAASSDYILMGRTGEKVPGYVYKIEDLPREQKHTMETYIHQMLSIMTKKKTK